MKKKIFALPVALIGLASATQGATLYGSDSLFNGSSFADSGLYTVDHTSGGATLVGHPFDGVNFIDLTALAFSTSGRLFGASGNLTALYEVDPSTGAVTFISHTKHGAEFVALQGLAFAASGKLYGTNVIWNGADYGGSNLYEVNTNTGILTLVGPTFDGLDFIGISGLAFDASGTLFGSTASLTALYEVDPSTGTVTFVGHTKDGDDFIGLEAIAFDASGNLFGSSATLSMLYEVDPSTGGLTMIGNTTNGASSVGLRGLEFAPSAVFAPEPATLAIFALGLAGLGLMRRWRTA